MIVFYLWSDRNKQFMWYMVNDIGLCINQSEASSDEQHINGNLRPLHHNESIWFAPGTFEEMYNHDD